MLEQYRNLFQLVRESVFSLDSMTALSLSAEEWNAICQEMQNQTIIALPYVALTSCPIPDAELKEKWLKACVLQQVVGFR